MIHRFVLHNDAIVPSDEAVLRPGQVGLFSGWGVFSTLRIYQGIPFAFERHWERLTRDAALLHVEMPPSRDELRSRLIELVVRNDCPEAKMRVNVMRSQGGLFEGPGSGRPSDVVAFTADLSADPGSVVLALQPHGRDSKSEFAGTKTLSWAHNLTLFENAQRAGFADALLLNERGEVSECTSANVFAVTDGVTLTPPLASGSLPGVTRAVMLVELGEPVEERVLYPDDLYAADEVFITSSTRELMPVTRIGDQSLKKTDWPVMHCLRSRLREYIDKYLKAAR
ncbi:MAG: aminotransferase class IV [Bryobacterales bacterium]|nr:aminotransferase class IV [Bryobacterales bacterium]MDE0622569.1 aminotransferase class IV [Bryobacterales bacterium]